MPNYKQYRSSKYLKKDEFERPKVATISYVSEENVAPEGSPKKVRLVAHFDELDKGLVLNMSNCDVVAELTGEDDTDGWAGTVVELFNDPEIRFQGKKTGGIRLRKPIAQPY